MNKKVYLMITIDEQHKQVAKFLENGAIVVAFTNVKAGMVKSQST